MDSRLTLKPDQQLIEKAKYYAKTHKKSLSSIIENYLQRITDEKRTDEPYTPLVKSLSGIINLPEEKDNGYGEYLTEKYK